MDKYTQQINKTISCLLITRRMSTIKQFPTEHGGLNLKEQAVLNQEEKTSKNVAIAYKRIQF